MRKHRSERVMFVSALIAVAGAGCFDVNSAGKSAFDPPIATDTSAVLAPCERELRIPLPAGQDRRQLVLGASESMLIADRVSLRRPALGFAAAANTGNGPIELGTDTITGALSGRGRIELRDRARVNGSIVTESELVRGNSTVVAGPIQQGAALAPAERVAWAVCFPATTSGDVMLEPDRSRTLPPGDYATLHVKSRAQLSLRSGRYTFHSITIEPQAQLLLDKAQGPIALYSSGGFVFRGATVDRGGDPADFLVGVLGAEAVLVDAPFAGTIVAPDAAIDLASVSLPGHRGQFFGRRIVASPGSQLTLAAIANLGPILGPDTDLDGVADPVDNCPRTANANQGNADGDDEGDACDPCPQGGSGVAVIGPAGGRVCSSDERMALVVPPGALSALTTITVAPSQATPTGGGIMPGTLYEFEPHGLTFAVPASVTVTYADGSVPAGIAESSLVVLSSMHGTAPLAPGDPWEERPSSVDPVSNRVTGTIEHFSHDGVGPPVVRVEMSGTNITLDVGATTSLTAQPFDANNNPINHLVVWTSNNAQVAPVTASSVVGAQVGTVLGASVGQAIITASVANSGLRAAGSTVVNVVQPPRRVTFDASLFVLDDDNSTIGESDDCGEFTISAFCDVDRDHTTATVDFGGPGTCVDDEVMSNATAKCTLGADQATVTVEIVTRLFESNTCPNGEQEGTAQVTLVLPPGSGQSRNLTPTNGDDFATWNLAVTNVQRVGSGASSLSGGRVSCP